jgi:hypothetical protein
MKFQQSLQLMDRSVEILPQEILLKMSVSMSWCISLMFSSQTVYASTTSIAREFKERNGLKWTRLNKMYGYNVMIS